jgi:hypothetical protein
MNDSQPRIAPWPRSLETLMFMAHDAGIRTLGLANPDFCDGVSFLGRSIAEISADAGVVTLLLDLSRPAVDQGGWNPRSNGTDVRVARDPAGFDIIYGDCTPASRGVFNNVAQLRNAINGKLASYGMIVINMAPVADIPDDAINPIAVARACDGVILVGTLGVTTRDQLERTMESMRSVEVKLIGSVVFSPSATVEQNGERRRSHRRDAKKTPRSVRG